MICFNGGVMWVFFTFGVGSSLTFYLFLGFVLLLSDSQAGDIRFPKVVSFALKVRPRPLAGKSAAIPSW